MDLINTSKYLSLILRHKPEAIGITLDQHGWANVNELIKGMKIDMKTLETIVNTDEKKRYSFSKDKTKIRANQGHSINVDVEPMECEPPKYLLHGTAKKYEQSIEEQGLIPKSRLYVQLSEDRDTAIMVGRRHGEPIIYTIDAKKMYDDGYKFYKSVNEVWMIKEVPAKYFIRKEIIL